MIQRFSIHSLPFGTDQPDSRSRSFFELRDNSTGECARILPFLGGAINELKLRLKDRLTSVIHGYTDEQDIQDHHLRAFRSAQLFPFPNRIRNGRYRYGKQSLQLPINFPEEGVAIHGLIHDRPFTPIDTEEGPQGCRLTLSLTIAPGNFPGYPFAAYLEVNYRLSQHSLEISTIIANRDRLAIPAGYGFHPYFRCGSTTINSYRLQLPPVKMLETDGRLLPTGELTEFSTFDNPQPLTGQNLDHCFKFQDKTNHIVQLSGPDGCGIQLTLSQTIPYLQIYTPPHRQSIALEPMTCAPDSFNNGMGLHLLAPGEELRTRWTVSTL